jgi:hypothetical protein
VDSAAARVVLHRSACSRGYKLSREGADPRSFLRCGLCVDVLARCVCVRSSFFASSLDVAPASPFIVFKERARVTCVVKKWEKRQTKKGGLRCGRLPTYPVGAISPVAQRCNRR